MFNIADKGNAVSVYFSCEVEGGRQHLAVMETNITMFVLSEGFSELMLHQRTQQ